MMRAAEEAQKMLLMREAANDAARLATAEEFYNEGDVRVASRMFVRVALSRPKNEITDKAKQRLGQLAEEARQKLREIETKLTAQNGAFSPGEAMSTGGSLSPGILGPGTLSPGMPGPAAPAGGWKGQVVEAFRVYDELNDLYGGVPVAKDELKRHVARQRRRPEYAAVLNEPEAKALWESGQEHEADDQQCCAYWVYREASRLKPAPSALLAAQRLAQMQEDSRIVVAAKACRELQQCHKLYRQGELLVVVKPAKARELFAQILGRAPEDSEVYRAARKHVDRLR